MNKEQAIMKNFRDIFNKIAWLNKGKMEEALKGNKPSEVHCIEAIQELNEPNVRRLTEALFMTRGAVSKLTKRLEQRGLIESYKNPDNKKEVYFRLTEAGTEIYQTHEDLHKEFQRRDQEVFDNITDEEFKTMMQFVEKYNAHLDKEIKDQGLLH
ncbi:MarR family transcriptional regulator [Staphylococcus caprae]|uniref:MarR family winged helix-turn-helix transcriptional regulator n=1 Tax=Staphylococcus TaxID=1279 RepID=UPI0008A8B804|nr:MULTISPECIES: MarR family transcriptional regulator [Staphylococcus]MCI2954114.1 MarR family transcriptional regulator [Staphylococcus caprae]OHS39701.1 MarR family transcriptional regulator [Staphylococcus sp. HMSC62A08]